MTYSSIPLDDASSGKDEEKRDPKTKAHSKSSETTPGDQESIKWEVVAEQMGLLPAQIIAGRLQSEGIPARAWQESAGQAVGLIVGKMGTGYVSVPDTFVEQALEILESDDEVDEGSV